MPKVRDARSWAEGGDVRMSERGAQSGDGETGVCHICSETFGTQEELAGHLREQHEQEALGDVRPLPGS
jgi:hypothetical protein